MQILIIRQAESEKERDDWVAAIQEAISSTLNAQSTSNNNNLNNSVCPSLTVKENTDYQAA